MFGVDRYPTLEEKACALAYAIIDGHVFEDGNKRTGAEVLSQVLELNCHRFEPSSDDEFQAMMEGVGEDVEFPEFVDWTTKNSQPKPGGCDGG